MSNKCPKSIGRNEKKQSPILKNLLRELYLEADVKKKIESRGLNSFYLAKFIYRLKNNWNKSNKEIAQELGIHLSTVNYYLNQLGNLLESEYNYLIGLKGLVS